MHLNLTNKKALVTGSTRGIGLAIAKSLLQEGCQIAIHGSSEQSVNQALEAFENNPNVFAVFGNLEQANIANQLTDQLERQAFQPDILINNAAVFINHGWQEASTADWLRLYQINVVSHVGLIKRLSQSMQDQGWGRIINISSGESSKPFAHMPDYAATKAAMNNFTVSLSKSLAATGVTVNTISPGIIRSKQVEAWYKREAEVHGWGTDWPSIEKGVLRDVLDNNCGRLGFPEEVAHLVTFLSSPLADYINGANLRIDGGSTDHIN